MKQKWHVKVIAAVAMMVSLLATTTMAQASDIDDHRDCAYCGMDRKAYGFSRMLIRYQDGAAVGVCSLHCAVTELDANPGRAVQAMLVADRDTRAMIEAEKAVWVMGGKKRGVMTGQPKWAFQTKAAAEAFIKEYEGKIVTWAEVLAAARAETAKK
jgi:nitrous oxide reductase accessory protein NosL